MKHLFSILLLLAGYAAAAQHNWLQGAGSNANDEALDIAHDVYGNVYSAGYFSQSARFDHTIIPSAGLSDVFIAKQDSAGTFLWIAKAGGTLDDKAFAVAVAPSGDIYVAGVYKGTATFGAYTFTSSGGSQDVFVAKLNSSGNFIWAKSFGGSDVDIATDIAVDPHNNVIVSGQFKGVAQFGSFAFTSVNYPLTMPVDGGTPSYDAFLFRMNAAGTVLWAKQGAAVYDDRILKLGVDDQSHIYACGQFSDTLHFANTYNNNAFNAGFVMRFDSTGAEQWFHRLVATQFMTYDMAVEGGAVWLTGDFSGMLDYVGTPSNYISGTYTHKTFVLKADAVTGNYMAGTSESSNNDIINR